MRKYKTHLINALSTGMLLSIQVIEYKGVKQLNKVMRIFNKLQNGLVESVNFEILESMNQNKTVTSWKH